MSETLTVTVDDGGTYTVDVKGVSLFTDAGLTTPATFPVSVSADTTWYAAAPSRAGRRDNIEVVVTTSVGTRIPVETFNGLPVTVNLTEGTVDYSAPAPSTASAPAGSPVVRAFPFAFDTPGLVTGHTVYTPTVGDLLLDAWIVVETAWDGTTPKADFGTFVDDTSGLLAVNGIGPTDMTLAMYEDNTGIANIGNTAQLSSSTQSLTETDMLEVSGSSLVVIGNPFSSQNSAPVSKFTAANPVKVCVSTTGAVDGSSPGASAGAATLYLVTATPAT